MLYLTACACIPLCHLTKTACSFLKSVLLCLDLTSNQRGCTYFVGSSRFEQPSWPEPLPLPELWDPHEPPPAVWCVCFPIYKVSGGMKTAVVRQGCSDCWWDFLFSLPRLLRRQGSSAGDTDTPLGLFAVGLKVRQVAAVYSAVSVGPHSLCEEVN